jgi:hypothetical protein
MRNRRLAILGGVAIAALILALTPDPAAARGGFGGGGFHGGGFHGGGGGFGGGFRGGGFAGGRAVAIGGFRGGGLVARPGWGGAWRPGWGGGWAGWRPGWRGGSGGWGWGWPVAAGVAAGVAASNWGYYDDPYAGYSQCLFWNGFAWVNGCDQTYGYW